MQAVVLGHSYGVSCLGQQQRRGLAVVASNALHGLEEGLNSDAPSEERCEDIPLPNKSIGR
jgi:hypothetical protein